MERLPPNEFGRTLRALIRERWKTQTRYADEIGFDQTWVARVIRGDQENLTYQSLKRLLSGFVRSADQELIYNAWLDTYAPSPVACQAPEVWSTDEELAAYAASVHELIPAVGALSTFHALGRLWSGLKADPKRAVAALTVAGSYVEAAQQLDRISLAGGVVSEMIGAARPMMEPALLARSLWLRGVNARLVRPRQEVVAEKAFEEFGAFLDDWQPRSAVERRVHREYRQILARDRVLSALDLFKAGVADGQFLAGRIEGLQGKTSELEDVSLTGLASEVIARALVATGDLAAAWDALRKARECATTKANELKVVICEIQLFEAASDKAKAEERLGIALDMADTYGLVHHRQKLSGIQRRLETLQATRRVFTLA